MKLRDCRIILTGAAGGIGRHLALALAEKGARLALVERNAQQLEAVCAEIAQRGGQAVPILADLGAEHAADQVVSASIKALGGVDVLINNAGLMDFIRFEQQHPARIEQLIHTNVTVPLLLTRSVLPHLLAQGGGRIVNIGSALGAIGMAYHAAYCASKFALRGFSEALRRELTDTPIGVTYIAPRATRTALNDDRATRMLEATGAALDQPQEVARQIVVAIERGRKEHAIGQPERIFARLNGLVPRLIDLGLQKQSRIARQFTRPND
jgi:short-subunit dehydrogenase